MPETTFDPRRAEPGQSFTWHDQWGERHEFKADDDGVLRPQSQAEAEAADSFGLPVARKVIAEERAAARAADTSTPARPAKEG